MNVKNMLLKTENFKKKLFFFCFFLLVVFFKAEEAYANEWIDFAEGVQLLENEKEVEAIERFKKALDKNPSMTEAYQMIGYIYQYKLENFQEAERFYLKGLKYVPDDWQLNINLMYTYFKMNLNHQAIEKYKKLAEIRPVHRYFSFPRTNLIMILEDYDLQRKIEFCETLLSVNPADEVLRRYVANLYAEAKDYENAKKHYEMLINDGIVSGYIYFGLAISNYYLGDYFQALDGLNKAKELGAHVPDQYFEIIKSKMLKCGSECGSDRGNVKSGSVKSRKSGPE